MMTPYTLIENLPSLIDAITPDGIVSRTFYKGKHVKAILFGFDAGQELSEHTSSQTAIIQIVRGDAIITLGNERFEVTAGSWMHLTPCLKHSVYAKTPLILLLTMFDTEGKV